MFFKARDWKVSRISFVKSMWHVNAHTDRNPDSHIQTQWATFIKNVLWAAAEMQSTHFQAAELEGEQCWCVCWLVCPPLPRLFGLNYLNNYPMDYHEISYRYSWFSDEVWWWILLTFEDHKLDICGIYSDISTTTELTGIETFGIH